MKTFLLSINLKVSRSDPSLFYFINESSIIGYIAIHVDDIIWAGTNLFNINVIDKLRVKFKIAKESTVLFHSLVSILPVTTQLVLCHHKIITTRN